MFQAVRQWWRSSRRKRTSRLFAFELTVVMVGVLAAQQVSNWANDRSALRDVEAVHDAQFHNFEIYRRIAMADLKAVPCLQARVEQIFALSGTADPVDPALLVPVKLAGMGPDEITPESYHLLRHRYGDRVADQMGSMEFNLGTNETAVRDMDVQWYQFRRLDSSNGAVLTADRIAARDAAVRVHADLDAIERSARLIIELTDLLGIAANPAAELGPVADCAEMWRTHKAYRD